jgi:uncharacterized protein
MNRTFKAAVAALMLAVSVAGSVGAGPLEDVAAAYEKGDYATMLRLKRSLAEQGDAKAQYSLGNEYGGGVFVPKDDAASVNWYRKAAEQGYPPAQKTLGVNYYAGWGVPKDYVLSYMWFNLAAASGNKEAAEARELVASLMTPAQIAEAQKLAREWKPK